MYVARFNQLKNMIIHSLSTCIRLPYNVFTGLIDGMANQDNVWVGGRNVGSENSWYWSDGEPWFDAVLWGSGEETFLYMYEMKLKRPYVLIIPF